MNRKLPHGDFEGDMAKSELMKIEKYAKKLNEMIHPEDELEAWVQAKLSVVAAYMGDIKHYLDYQLSKMGEEVEGIEFEFANGGEVNKDDETYKDARKSAMKMSKVYGTTYLMKSRLPRIGGMYVWEYDMDGVLAEMGSPYHSQVIEVFIDGKPETELTGELEGERRAGMDEYRHGGKTKRSMYRYEPSSFADDMVEAKSVLGAKWNQMSHSERVSETKRLKSQGVVGYSGQEEDIETLSGMQYEYAEGGEIRRFDRHAQMDGDTRSEILDTINEFYLIDGFRNLQNYLYGLFDGYDYSQTDSFKKSMNELKSKNKSLHDRIEKIYDKIEKYSFDKYARGGNLYKKDVGMVRASDGLKRKFVWIKEQNGVATEVLQQKPFLEDFKQLSEDTKFTLIRDDNDMKVFKRFSDDWKITYRLKPIF